MGSSLGWWLKHWVEFTVFVGEAGSNTYSCHQGINPKTLGQIYSYANKWKQQGLRTMQPSWFGLVLSYTGIQPLDSRWGQSLHHSTEQSEKMPDRCVTPSFPGTTLAPAGVTPNLPWDTWSAPGTLPAGGGHLPPWPHLGVTPLISPESRQEPQRSEAGWGRLGDWGGRAPSNGDGGWLLSGRAWAQCWQIFQFFYRS